MMQVAEEAVAENEEDDPSHITPCFMLSGKKVDTLS
jgi:hypothetical protein